MILLLCINKQTKLAILINGNVCVHKKKASSFWRWKLPSQRAQQLLCNECSFKCKNSVAILQIKIFINEQQLISLYVARSTGAYMFACSLLRTFATMRTGRRNFTRDMLAEWHIFTRARCVLVLQMKRNALITLIKLNGSIQFHALNMDFVISR